MTHPLIEQLRFTRHEWTRALNGVSPADAARHFGPMNCISWIVGHLAWHEQRYFLQFAQGQIPFPALNERYAFGAPMSTPDLPEMWSLWQTITARCDPFLDTLTAADLLADLPRDGQSVGQSLGSAVQRVIYHYWFHIGEILAIRQLLDHPERPEYVGDLEKMAPFRV